jgi:hypothetical protein
LAHLNYREEFNYSSSIHAYNVLWWYSLPLLLFFIPPLPFKNNFWQVSLFCFALPRSTGSHLQIVPILHQCHSFLFLGLNSTSERKLKFCQKKSPFRLTRCLLVTIPRLKCCINTFLITAEGSGRTLWKTKQSKKLTWLKWVHRSQNKMAEYFLKVGSYWKWRFHLCSSFP